MQRDTICNDPSLVSRVQALGESSARLVALRDRLVEDLKAKETEVEILGSTIDKLTKVGELFRKLMDLLVHEQVQAVKSLISKGFQAIFYDLDLSFEADILSKHNRVWIDFFIRHGQPDDPLSHRGKPLDSFGGGPSSVASLVLRIITLLKLKRYPLLVLDEALGAVSDEYTERTGMFLNKLADETGIDILLVTHKAAYLDHANQAYRSSEGVEGSVRYLMLKGLRHEDITRDRKPNPSVVG